MKQIPELCELNIGHSIISKSIFVGLQTAIKNMLDLINYLDSTNENENFIFGTNSFHHIFEQMVDSLFGESDKDMFYPKVF